MNGALITAQVIDIVTFIMGVFFVLRSLYCYKNWRNGDKDELWNFLSLIMGAVAVFLVVFGSFEFVFNPPFGLNTFYTAFIPFLVIALIAIGLRTYYLFLKWQKMK